MSSNSSKNNDSFNSILTTFYVSLGVGAALLILRYRKKNPRLRVVDVPKYPRGFLAWTLQCWRMSDQEFLAQVGLDGYMVIRFIRLCRRLCWCAALLGMCILTPIYVTGGVYAHSSVFFLTMTNLPAGSESLWATVAFAWVFMLYLLHELRKEHLKFTALRNDWLANGDLPSQRQAAYSVMIESIPEAFRCVAAAASALGLCV
ncbi:late exocytosis, associated with Golgi transport-domain-containing protein [Tribonema minus]|uniref:Late exocytosis, associated with Golgi transport-domain-containing protein n=1 Tax=Tribonema minus TaxID=303371 RepID=A0A835ZH71_9STRA|nr:late exocytosis, associated with Golgi transport-domain-containing protein [Tribonema minus]